MKGKTAIIFFLNNDYWQKPSQLRGPADGWALPHSRYERNSFIQRQSRGLLIRLLFGFIIFKRHISTALLSRGEIQCNMLYPCSFQETFTCAVFHLYLFKRPSLVFFSNFRRHPPTTIHDGGRMVGRSDGSPHRWGKVSSSYESILNNQCFFENIFESKWTFVFFRKNIIGIFPANYVKCIQMRGNK